MFAISQCADRFIVHICVFLSISHIHFSKRIKLDCDCAKQQQKQKWSANANERDARSHYNWKPRSWTETNERPLEMQQSIEVNESYVWLRLNDEK